MNNKKRIQQSKNANRHSTLNAGRLKRTFVWLRRIRRCRGFGVQSPWAYKLVCNVINKPHPHPIYKSLAAKFNGQNHVRRKLNELYLRLAKEIQPSTVVDFCGDDEVFMAYIGAGHDKARFMSPNDLPKDGIALIRLRTGEKLPLYINKVWQAAEDGWAVVVEDIHGCAKARQQWRELRKMRDHTVSFDLYYCGLVFFDSKRYKQNYIINF